VHALSQVCVVVDGDRYDVSVPSSRPVVEYLADLLALTGRSARSTAEPAEPATDAHAWSLRSVGAAAPIPPPWTLADAGVRDGAVLLLERGTNGASGDRVVDNLAGTVADVVAARAPRTGPGSALSLVAAAGCVALIAPAAVVPLIGPLGGVLSALAALVLTVLAAAAPSAPTGDAGTPPGRYVAAFAGPGAALHAAMSAWASTDAASPAVRVACALAAGGIVAAALAAVVDVAPVRAALAGIGSAALGGAAVVGVAVATRWAADLAGLVALAAGLAVLAAAGQLGFKAAGVPGLDRARPTESAVRARVGFGRLLVSAFHVTGGLLIAGGAAAVFTGDDPRRWLVGGLVTAVAVVRLRACAEPGQALPLAVAVAVVVGAFGVLVVGPRAGWVAVHLGGLALGCLLVAIALAPRKQAGLRPLIRRRLGRLELALAMACVPVMLYAADVVSAAFEAGRGVL
jgi:type VII secretion integral membrane protein EccD